MKKRNLLIIIVGLIIASLVITLVILNNKNKDKDKTPTDKNLISINIVMFYITFFNKCINDKTIKIIVIYEMNLQDI